MNSSPILKFKFTYLYLHTANFFVQTFTAHIHRDFNRYFPEGILQRMQEMVGIAIATTTSTSRGNQGQN